MKIANDCETCHKRRFETSQTKMPSASDPIRKPLPTPQGSPPRKIKVRGQTDLGGGPGVCHLLNKKQRPSAPLNHAATPTFPTRCSEHRLLPHRLFPVCNRLRVQAPWSDSLPIPRQPARNWRGGRDRRQYESQSAAWKAADFRPEGH